jgi:hypothetical protein
MQVRQVLLARAIQLARAATNIGWLPDLFQEIGAKYEFAIVPKPEEVFRAEPNKAVFKHGRLDTNVVDTLTLNIDGFVVDTTTSTDNAALFLNDFLQWLTARVPNLKEVGKPFYLSQLEVNLEFGQFRNILGSVGQQIFELLERYELSGVKPYAFSNLQIAQDPLGKIGLQLSAFGIERRLNVAFADNIFFAQAPLKTQDHISVLESLERALAGI